LRICIYWHVNNCTLYMYYILIHTLLSPLLFCDIIIWNPCVRSDCCLTPGEQFFSHIMARISCIMMRQWSLFCRTTLLRGVPYTTGR
jgi:hypothetical protein